MNQAAKVWENRYYERDEAVKAALKRATDAEAEIRRLREALELGETFARDFLAWLENEASAEEWDGGDLGYTMGGFASMATEFLDARAALAGSGEA